MDKTARVREHEICNMKKKVVVRDNVQKGYAYSLTEPAGKNFDPEFRPELTPKEMLELGVFGGDYLYHCQKEFPAAWFRKAKMVPDGKKDPSLNYYKVDASLPLKVWQKKGWIYKEDPRGWFQWYCRYFMGRRIPEEDRRQIKRWKAIKRHAAAVKKNCKRGDETCRPKQRQVLLHWAYDAKKY